ncbi:hypothetical protein PFICI_03841 [Pestalotiopsis fici W106-1]|uniref:Uncharacterized protein n=1 Tax=Pestalotiopsis fici (strain W106-1 / CGMCC3.15140) TaxID=1229662 RepID=W3XKR3_PESFW|nr:uncharacterized protein PFICI_03841 [Pestalotiopsis fici W106-1]ETS85816.1 hypothetical protein PFICI_03841 [Pestalotiopsis fici W106-1]
MIGSHRDQAHFDRARWRKRILLPCWIVQVPILLTLVGLFSYRLSNTVREFKNDELKGDVPMVEFVWECVNIAFSAASLVINLVQIAKFIAEALTPFAMVFGNAVSLTLSAAILALDITVYIQHDDRHYSSAGIGLDCALLFFTIVPIIYGTIVFRRLSKLDEYHLQHNVKAFGFSSEYDTSYNPKRTSLNDADPEALYDPGSTSSRRQSFSLKNVIPSKSTTVEPAKTSPKPAMERRESYNHERDTKFDEYIARRASISSAQEGGIDLGLGSEFGGASGTRSRGNSLTRTSWDPNTALSMMDAATQQIPARGHALNAVPESLEEEDIAGSTKSTTTTTTSPPRSRPVSETITGAGTVDRHASVNSGVSSVTDVTAVTGVSAMSSHHNYVSQARDPRGGQEMEEIELRN